MREPVPFRRPVRATFVESNGHTNGNGLPHVPDDVADEEEMPDNFLADDFDDEDDEQADAEAVREVASNEAPWSPTPVRPAREYIRKNDDSSLNIVFPTVYDEDRTAKMKDLSTAQSVGAITHQRMSEQMAKELGFEQYDYKAELQQIIQENKKLSPTIATPSDQALAAIQKSEEPSVPSMKVGPPTPGLAPDENPEPVRRNDLSGPVTAEFRKQQRDTASHLSEVAASVQELRRLVTSGQQSDSTAKLVGALDMAFARLEKSLATPPVVNVEAPPQPVVNVEVPAPQRPLVVALESETPPRHVQVIRDERGLITEMREVEVKTKFGTPPSAERLNEVIDSAFARFEERAGSSTDRAASRDHLIESITSALLAQFSQRRNVKVIRDERGLITEMRDES